MRIGLLRHRVVVYTRVLTYDENGQPIETFSSDTTRWARVTVNPLQESEIYDGVQSKESISITMRSYDKLVPSNRIGWGSSKVYNIISATDPTGLGIELEVEAERIR